MPKLIIKGSFSIEDTEGFTLHPNVKVYRIILTIDVESLKTLPLSRRSETSKCIRFLVRAERF